MDRFIKSGFDYDIYDFLRSMKRYIESGDLVDLYTSIRCIPLITSKRREETEKELSDLIRKSIPNIEAILDNTKMRGW